ITHGAWRHCWALAVAAICTGCVLLVDDYSVGGSGGGGSDGGGDVDGGGRDALSGGGDGEGAARSCGGFKFGGETCSPAITSACCDELAACRNDSICRPWQECVAKCRMDDPDCRGVCSVLTKTNSVMADLLACKARSCPASVRYDIYGLLSPDCG